jgi:hypothetical protein
VVLEDDPSVDSTELSELFHGIGAAGMAGELKEAASIPD